MNKIEKMIIDNTLHININKWNFLIGIVPVYWRKNAFEFHVGLFKITKLPQEGEGIKKENYKGFWIRIPIRDFGISIHF